jgi:hypothetical protein
MCFLKILEIHNDGSSPSGHPPKLLQVRLAGVFVLQEVTGKHKISLKILGAKIMGIIYYHC